MVEARRTFAPVVLVTGLASGAVAMAGTQPWHAVTSSGRSYECQAPCVGVSFTSEASGTGWAFGLVMLAALGVVLVSRGRFRRAVAALGLLAALGAVVAAVDAAGSASELRDTAERYGVPGLDVDPTGWLVVGLVATALSVLAWTAAVVYAGRWPEMGRRYDTPSDAPPDDLWKAMDQGHDPTS